MASKKKKWTKDALAQKEQEFGAFLQHLAEDKGGRQYRNQVRSVALTAGRDLLFLQQLESVAARIGKRIARAPQGYSLETKKSVHPTERELTLNLGDCHFQALINGRESPVQYGPKEEARRLAAVCLQVAEYKLQHRKETSLLINILGDIIQNLLHDEREGAPLAQQCMAALDYLVQLITFEAARFKQVIVRCTPGNHGRNKARHKKMAIFQKWDAHETFIYFALQKALAHLPNVTVQFELTPYYTYKSFDNNVFVTHGDTVFRVGYPGSSIDTKVLEQATDKINGAQKRGEQFNLFLVGHVHMSMNLKLNNGVTVITNPALIPVDHFGVGAMGNMQSACGQNIFESVKGHPVGDFRTIDVGPDIDKDRSLDKIIRPFTL